MALKKKDLINKGLVSARLNNHPTSPRKMRLVVDIIRGKDVHLALDILRHSKKHAALPLEKLLLSAISNFQVKFPEDDVEKAGLFIQEIRVDSGSMLKRLRPAPQGRGHRIRKRSNHVTLVLGMRVSSNENKSIDS